MFPINRLRANCLGLVLLLSSGVWVYGTMHYLHTLTS